MAGPERMTIEEVVRKVLRDEHADVIRESVKTIARELMEAEVAELIGAQSGIGHMIMDSQRLLDTGQMIFGIFIIGLIGLISDFLFKKANERLFPWYFIK